MRNVIDIMSCDNGFYKLIYSNGHMVLLLF